MNISLIVVVIVTILLGIFAIVGYVRGFLKIALTTFSLVLTLLIVSICAKPLANWLKNDTPLGEKIETKIETYISEKLRDSAYTLDSQDLKEQKIISSLPIPSSVKETLLINNTLSDYAKAGVSGFSQYIAVNVASIAINAMVYIGLAIIITIILRIIVYCSDIINKIPVVGGINRLMGALLGIIEMMMFLWILCIGVMIIAGTELGQKCVDVIESTPALKLIYDNNFLLAIVNDVFGTFTL